MSNVAIAHPNRLLEYKAIHQKSTDWNTALPLANILTDVLPETARTQNAVKRTSFGISLSSLPYRNLSAIALVNHNLSTSAKVRFTVMNEPPTAYLYYDVDTSDLVIDAYVTFSGTQLRSSALDLDSHTLRLYIFSNDSKTKSSFDDYIEAFVHSHDLATGDLIFRITKRSVRTDETVCRNWMLYDLGLTNSKNVEVMNVPQWMPCWQRIYGVESSSLTWRSRNFWRGTVELEIMELVTKVHISFLTSKDVDNVSFANANSNVQPLGTHLHIDIDDSSELEFFTGTLTPNPDYSPYIELGRVFMGGYMQANINPEYGGITHGVKDNSEFQQSDSGQKFFHEKARARTASIQWNHLDKDEAFGNLLLSQLQQGISREILYTYSVEKIDTYQLLQSFIGRYVDLNPIQQPNVGLYSNNINLEEIL